MFVSHRAGKCLQDEASARLLTPLTQHGCNSACFITLYHLFLACIYILDIYTCIQHLAVHDVRVNLIPLRMYMYVGARTCTLRILLS